MHVSCRMHVIVMFSACRVHVLTITNVTDNKNTLIIYIIPSHVDNKQNDKHMTCCVVTRSQLQEGVESEYLIMLSKLENILGWAQQNCTTTKH